MTPYVDEHPSHMGSAPATWIVVLHLQIPAPAKVVQVLGALLSSEAESAAGGLHIGGEGMWGTDDGDSSGSEDELEGSALEHVENEAILKAAG